MLAPGSADPLKRPVVSSEPPAPSSAGAASTRSVSGARGSTESSGRVSSPVNSCTPFGTAMPAHSHVTASGSATVQTTWPSRRITSVLPASFDPVSVTADPATKSLGGTSNAAAAAAGGAGARASPTAAIAATARPASAR
ncbi:MAG: hypothetical protein B7Y93_00255 [Micrococcales bacterium 32-70-13]|nr:MAG: hypothetical protein B7Y93_00255 [Micrococcales bacterium 32-70-13]